MDYYDLEQQTRNLGFPLSATIVRMWRQAKSEESEGFNLNRKLSNTDIKHLRAFYNSIPDDGIVTEGIFKGYWPKMLYFNEVEKENFRVYFNENSHELSYLVNEEFVPIDTTKAFLQFFNRQSEEDDNLLGLLPSSEKAGKSKLSCFIITDDLEDEKLYIFPYRARTIHHNALSPYSRMIASGMVRIEKGKICLLNNKLGHYKGDYSTIVNFIQRIHEITDNRSHKVFKDIFLPERDIEIFPVKDRLMFKKRNTIRIIKEEFSRISRKDIHDNDSNSLGCNPMT